MKCSRDFVLNVLGAIPGVQQVVGAGEFLVGIGKSMWDGIVKPIKDKKCDGVKLTNDGRLIGRGFLHTIPIIGTIVGIILAVKAYKKDNPTTEALTKIKEKNLKQIYEVYDFTKDAKEPWKLNVARKDKSNDVFCKPIEYNKEDLYKDITTEEDLAQSLLERKNELNQELERLSSEESCDTLELFNCIAELAWLNGAGVPTIENRPKDAI